MEAARNAPGIILGPVDHLQYPPRDQGSINPSGELRVKLDLFANIRPAKSRMGVGLTGKPVDLVIFRVCTEGFYADRNMFTGCGEFMPTEDKANPTSLILSAAMLLEWLAARHQRPEFGRAAQAIETAIDAALKAPATRTADLGGTLGTRAFAAHLSGALG